MSPGLWRHPEDESHRFNDVDHWVELAKLLESAKFHSIFIADVLGKKSSFARAIFICLYSVLQAVMMCTRGHEILTLPLSRAHSGQSMNLWQLCLRWQRRLRVSDLA